MGPSLRRLGWRRLGCLVAVVSTGLVAAAAPAQQAAPAPTAAPAQGQLTFRAEANFIEVDAIVTDAQGRFVRDLTAGDFEVLENKKPQTVDVFSLVDIPVERADKPLFRADPVPPDVATNERPFEGRLWVIVLDSHHIAPTDTNRAKRTARLFVEKYLGANDLAAVIHSQTGRVTDNQEFTSNKADLLKSIDKFIGEMATSRAQMIMRDQEQKSGGQQDVDSRDSEATVRAVAAKDTLGTLIQVSMYMAGVSGRRKAVLFISTGLDMNLDDTIGPDQRGPADPLQNSMKEAFQAADVVDDMHAMFQAASRGNVAIFSVDPRGVGAADDNLMQMQGSDAGSFTKAMREQVMKDQGILRTFSDVTGGIPIVATNNYDDLFKKVVDDNSTYYVLGYHPPNSAPDGKFHEITVRVKRPGLQVRARKGYYAMKPVKGRDEPAAPFDPGVALLNSPIAVGGLALRLTTSMSRTAAASVAVQLTVEVPKGGIDPTAKNAGKIEFVYAVVEMGGAVKSTGRKTMDLSMNRPESRQSVADYGLRLVTEIALPPGHYQLRLAGRDVASGKAGSVFTDLEVPDFAKGPLVIGNLLLTSTHAGRTPTSLDAPSLSTDLPGPPTADRTFDLEETLIAYAEIADNDREHPHTVDLVARIRSDDGTQVSITRDERNSADADKATGVYKYQARLPLQDLVPGTYVLTVEARSRLGGEPVTREVQFTIK